MQGAVEVIFEGSVRELQGVFHWGWSPQQLSLVVVQKWISLCAPPEILKKGNLRKKRNRFVGREKETLYITVLVYIYECTSSFLVFNMSHQNRGHLAGVQ